MLKASDSATHVIQGLGKEFTSLGRIAETALGFAGGQVMLAGLQKGFDAIGGAVFGMNATLETSTLQFKTLMGSAELAKAHVESLFQIAKETPFETGPIIAMSQSLEAFGGAALNTEANIRLIGDAAAATGSPIQELGFWVGRMYSSLQSGKPFGEAAMRLQELKVLTPAARDAMELLQETGGSTAAAWDIMTTSFGKFSGAMVEQSGTWQGLVSTFTDSANIIIGSAFKPLFEEAKTALGGVNQFLDSEDAAQWSTDMSEAVKTVIRSLGGVPESANPVRDFLVELPKWITKTEEPIRGFVKEVENLNTAIGGIAGAKDAWGAFFAQLAAAHAGMAGSGLGGRGVLTPADYARMMQPPAAADTPLGAAETSLGGVTHEQRVAAALAAGEASYAAYLRGQQQAAAAAPPDRAPGGGLTGAFGDPEKTAEAKRKADEAAARAQASAAERAIRDQEAAYREMERLAQEYHRTKAITPDLLEGAFARADMATVLGSGRSAFEALRRVIEEGGQQNIDAVGQMASEMATRFRRDALTPEDAEDWIGAFLDALNVTIVTQSVDAARNVGELVKAFDVDRQVREAMRKFEDAVNVGLDDTERAIVEAQGRTRDAVTKLLNDAFVAESVKARMDELQEAVRAGMKALAAEHDAGLRALTATREGRDLGTRDERATIERDESRAAARTKIEEDYQKRIAEIRRRGGAGMGAATGDAGRAYMEQKQALEDRFKLEDKNRSRQQEWAAQDRMIRDADQAVNRERSAIVAGEQAATQARLELPIKQLQLAIQQRDLAQQIADLRKADADNTERLNAALLTTIERLQRARDIDIQRTGGAVPGGGGGSAGLGGGAGRPQQVNTTVQINGPVGSDEIIEAVTDAFADAAQRLAYS